jgi:acetoin utilization deacetylase AcuC-like enzyme
MCSTSARSMISNVGWMAPGVLTTTRPPDAATRRISARAPARSGMNIKPIWHSTTSYDSSGKGSEVASPTCQSIAGSTGAAVDVATSIMSGARSMAVTAPSGPTRSAARRATTPVPQATSSTRSPGRMSAAASRPEATGVAMAGT